MERVNDMVDKTQQFISTLAPIARNEYLSRKRWVLPSVCISMGALESGWNLNAKTLFGIKGSGFKATTSEYFDGHYHTIVDSFRTYPNVSSAVVGYYDLITGHSRYAGAVNNSDYKSTITAIKNGGYATDPNYVTKVISIIEKYGLTKYDIREVRKSNEEIANEVISGKWSNGQERINRLTSKGYNATEIQNLVNAKLTPKSYEEVAKEVIKGLWSNGSERKKRLSDAGYDYNKVQNLVNKLI